MITCTRRLTFCAGHRVMGHENKCANLHGHNYVVEVTAGTHHPGTALAKETTLDSIGRIIDFSVLKEKIGGWLEQHWDHAFIYSEKDVSVFEALRVFQDEDAARRKDWRSPFNPTAENMADYLLRIVCRHVLQGTGVVVTRIRIYETENCWADASL